jgi:hypothetical protein
MAHKSECVQPPGQSDAAGLSPRETHFRNLTNQRPRRPPRRAPTWHLLRDGVALKQRRRPRGRVGDKPAVCPEPRFPRAKEGARVEPRMSETSQEVCPVRGSTDQRFSSACDPGGPTRCTGEDSAG